MWKIAVLVTAIFAPGTPPQTIGSFITQKSFANEATCKQEELSKQSQTALHNIAEALKKKLDLAGVTIATKCIDASKKDAPATDNTI